MLRSCFRLIAPNVLPVPICEISLSWSFMKNKTKSRSTLFPQRIAASPRPMQHSISATFVGPTGARTEIKMSPGLAIVLGAMHQTLAVGCRCPNSAFP